MTSNGRLLRPGLEVPKTSRWGRPRADARAVFEAFLFRLHTGMQWKFLPRTFPPQSTVHDYLTLWRRSEAFRKLFARGIGQLVEHGRVDLDECFVDATFAAAKAGGIDVGLTRKGKGTKLQVIVDAQGVPLGLSVASVSTRETAKGQQTLAFMEAAAQPERLIGDKGYDCDGLDEALRDWGIERIAPHRSNRRADTATPAGRPLRRYQRRWVVERTIAWLGQYRRLLTRWEKRASHFANFALLDCLMIALRHLPCY